MSSHRNQGSLSTATVDQLDIPFDHLARTTEDGMVFETHHASYRVLFHRVPALHRHPGCRRVSPDTCEWPKDLM